MKQCMGVTKMPCGEIRKKMKYKPVYKKNYKRVGKEVVRDLNKRPTFYKFRRKK